MNLSKTGLKRKTNQMTNHMVKLKEIRSFIIHSQKCLDEGDTIDVAEVQNRVKEVCQAIEEDPPNDNGETKNLVFEVMSALDDLAKVLKNQFEAKNKSMTHTHIDQNELSPEDKNK